MFGNLFESKSKRTTGKRKNARRPDRLSSRMTGIDPSLGSFTARVEMLEGRQMLATVYGDDFNRSSLTSGAPITYTTTQTSGNGTAAISSNMLQLSTAATSGVAGWVSVAATPSGNGWNSTLDSSTGVVTWTWNMRFARTGGTPSGFASSNYGNAFVLASDNNEFANASAKGYAVMFGNNGSPDTFRLVAFNAGLRSDYTTAGSAAGNALIVGTGSAFAVTTQSQSNDYYSFKTTYDPSSKQWSLYGRDDGSSAFADPTTGTFTSLGSFTESTAIYRGTALGKVGALWSHSTAANNTSQFDNFKIDVTAAAATAPAAPTITSITPGNGQLSVAFTAGSNGGSAITNYKYSTDGGTTFTALSLAATTSPIVITGLTNGTSYNVQIKAVNAVGDGTATASTAATPYTTANAPTITGITAGNGQLSVAFTAPSSNGGSAITNYEYSTNGGTSFTAVSPAATTSPITITGLTNGTSYNVQIRAVNAAGTGTATGSTAATPYTTA
ncbi:MAG: fibronectin type III domain-containing protein, partial [Planctomycetota bacterium]